MRVRAFALVLSLAFPLLATAADAPISRRDGFVLIWQSLKRPAIESKGEGYTDVPKGSDGSLEINYAKRRGILDELEKFYPDAPLERGDALIWLFRSRNVADVDLIMEDTLMTYLEKYPLGSYIEKNPDDPEKTRAIKKQLTEAELTDLITRFDQMLRDEVHETSFYSENFHGRGTAYGETFDMNALTAAHKNLPHNTIVKVTNVANNKSVIVRINDRGPFVPGRDMDLSLAAFITITERSKGKINARYERFGDVSIVGPCARKDQMHLRLPGRIRLLQGVPQFLELGSTMTLTANSSFVVLEEQFPDGESAFVQDWILPGEAFTFTPSIAGTYKFRIGVRSGQSKWMMMEVGKCG